MILFILATPLFCLAAVLPALFAEPDNPRLERGPLALLCLLTAIGTTLCLSFAILGGGGFWLFPLVAMAGLARQRGAIRRFFQLKRPRRVQFWSLFWGLTSFIIFMEWSDLLGRYSEGFLSAFAFFSVLALVWQQLTPAWGAPVRPSLSYQALEQRAICYGYQALNDTELTRRDRRRLYEILKQLADGKTSSWETPR
ncbi:hypothetical protein TUM12370_29220 [Salmonella enterica subsp. enterica serovar Choleraesuis]|nr:hypothetical protein TUM12370_29220 [Salmonella enterica subsp. enterica serovar Choleraesuis]